MQHTLASPVWNTCRTTLPLLLDDSPNYLCRQDIGARIRG
jgi:hypothetical protein